MTLDVRTSVSLAEDSLKVTPSEPLVFHVTVENPSAEERAYRATATGIRNAQLAVRYSDDFVIEPMRDPTLPAGTTGRIVIEMRPKPPATAFPAGVFVVGIEVDETLRGERMSHRLSARVDVSSVSLQEASLVATPKEPLRFTVTVDNATSGPRSYRATATGLKGARCEVRYSDDFVTDPRTGPTLRAATQGQILLEVTPEPPAISFPPGTFLVGIEVEDTTPSDPQSYLLSAEVQVQSVVDVVATLTKPHLDTRFRDRSFVRLRNEGAQDLDLRLSGSDPEDVLTFEFCRQGKEIEDDTIRVPKGASRALTVVVSAKTRAAGRPIMRPYEIVAHGPGGAVATTGTFTHRAVFPPLFFKVVVAVLVIIAGMFVARYVVHRFILDAPVFTWEELPDTTKDNGPEVAPRVGHTAVWVQYPRERTGGVLQQLWRSGVNWLLGLNPEEEGMIIWGGRDEGGELLGDGAFLRADDANWLRLTQADDRSNAEAPPSRSDHTAVWTGERMVVWGGVVRGAGADVDPGGEYDPVQRSWEELPAGGPSPRVGHTMTWTGDAVVVVGGVDATGMVRGDTWILTPGDTGDEVLSDGEWVQVKDFAIGSRHHHTATWTGQYLVVFGGFDETGTTLADAYAIAPADENPEWFPVRFERSPEPRGCHAALWTGSEVLFLGGASQRRPITSQEEAAAICRNTAAIEAGSRTPESLARLENEVLATDPEAFLLTVSPPAQEGAGPDFGVAAPDEPPPRHLGSDFKALWTANEATVLQAVPQLDSIAAVRYSPSDGSVSLPLPDDGTIGPLRGFTTVWINGGIIAWGGVESVDDPPPGTDPVAYSNGGALLVLPDR